MKYNNNNNNNKKNNKWGPQSSLFCWGGRFAKVPSFGIVVHSYYPNLRIERKGWVVFGCNHSHLYFGTLHLLKLYTCTPMDGLYSNIIGSHTFLTEKEKSTANFSHKF